MNVLWLLSLLIWNRIVDAATCIQHSDPLNPSEYTISNCTSGSSETTPHHNSTKLKHHQRDELSYNGASMFKISFSCLASDPEVCEKAKASFIKAGQIVSSVVRLQQPVTVNATFLPFCSTLDICPDATGKKVLGSAYPAVSHLMTDKSDNMTRMYPQALLKQFHNLKERPQFASFDINAKFNSDVYWYFDDNDNVTSQELDFLRIVIHEYVHGLGFINSWNNYLWSTFQQIDPNCTEFLTPMPLSPPNQLQSVYDEAQDADGPQPFWGFVEYPLDKLVRISGTNEWLSAQTTQLNAWGGSNVMFASLSDMYHSWQGSHAIDIARQLYNLSTHSGTLSVSDNNFGDVILETSLFPFSVGSSLSHFDNTIYDNSIDYLMVYQADPGLNIHQYVALRGGGPVGPKLLLILQKLGYGLVNRTSIPQPQLTAWQQPKNMVGTTDNPSPSVSHVAALVSTTSASNQAPTASHAGQSSYTAPFSLLVTMLAMLSLSILLI